MSRIEGSVAEEHDPEAGPSQDVGLTVLIDVDNQQGFEGDVEDLFPVKPTDPAGWRRESWVNTKTKLGRNNRFGVSGGAERTSLFSPGRAGALVLKMARKNRIRTRNNEQIFTRRGLAMG